MSREQGGPARPVAAYVYDGDGNRLQQIDYSGVQPITTTYTNDNLGLSQVLIADNGSSQTANLYGLDLISQDDGAQTRTLLADGLGSVRQELANDAIQTVTTYEPYGNILAQTGNSGTTYAFTGEQFDDSTGLLYLRARYYNPGLKLFISRDPFPGWLGLPASQHGYTYAQNNPVNLTDPTGNCPWCLVAAGAFYVGEVSRQTYNNMQEGMPFFEAIYYKNQDQAEILKAIKSGLLLPLEAIPGLDGAADSFLDQLIDNIADPCAGIFDSTLEATAKGAAVDLTFLGLGKSVGIINRTVFPTIGKYVNVAGEQGSTFKRVGPVFDSDKLRRIVQYLENQGAVVYIGDEIGDLLPSDTMAMVVKRNNRPPVIIFRNNPTRLEVVEELIHFQQLRSRSWKTGEDKLLDVWLDEVEAQLKLLDIGYAHGWTPDEMDRIWENLDYWLEKIGGDN